jgi:hypothetical protein
VKLQYLAPFASLHVHRDGRFRNYSIIPKGSWFLRTLKDVLGLTIKKMIKKRSIIGFLEISAAFNQGGDITKTRITFS